MRKQYILLLMAVLAAAFLPSDASAWYSTYTHRMPIITNSTTAIIYSVNDTGGVNGSMIWTAPYITGNQSFVYATGTGLTTPIAIANDTAQDMWENATSLSGNNVTGLWNQSGIVGRWHFDQGTGLFANDSTYTNNITLNGSTGWVQGKFGKALNFTGTTNGTATTTNLPKAAQARAISFCFKTTQNTASSGALGYGTFGAGRTGIAFYFGAGGQLFFSDYDENSAGPAGLNDGNWHCAVGNYNGTHMTLFVDKIKYPSTASAMNTDTAGLKIAASYLETYNGLIDEIAIYNSNISESTINMTYNMAVGNFSRLGQEVRNDIAITINNPDSATYYVSNHTLNFTVTGVNSTYPCWKILDGVTTSLGSVANSTYNTSNQNLNNSAHTLSITCYGGAPSANVSSTITPTVIYSELRAKNAVGGAAINTFTANFSNSTASTILFTTTGLIQAPLNALPQGAVNLTLTADGFGANSTTTYTINSTNFFNNTLYMSASSVSIYVYDERATTTLLTSNITFANSTTSKSWNGVTNVSQLYSNLTMGDTTITISSSGYTTRKYYMTITAQTLVNMSAYLLATASGQTVRFHVVDTSEAAISNALTTAQISISGVYVTTEQAYTDTSGTSTLFLDPTTSYQMVFTHPSYSTLTTTIQPSQQDYKVYLSTTTNINISYTYGDLQISLLPTDTALIRHSPGIQIFNYTIVAPSGDLTSWGWTISDNSLNVIYNKTITTSPFGGTDSYTLNFTNYTYWIYVDTFFNRGGNYTWNHVLFSLNNVTRMNHTISEIFDTMKNGKNITSNLDNVTNTLVIPQWYGYKPESLMLFGIVGVIAVMSFAATFFISNSGGIGVIGALCLLYLGYMGLMPTSLVFAVMFFVIAFLYLRGVI